MFLVPSPERQNVKAPSSNTFAVTTKAWLDRSFAWATVGPHLRRKPVAIRQRGVTGCFGASKKRCKTDVLRAQAFLNQACQQNPACGAGFRGKRPDRNWSPMVTAPILGAQSQLHGCGPQDGHGAGHGHGVRSLMVSSRCWAPLSPTRCRRSWLRGRPRAHPFFSLKVRAWLWQRMRRRARRSRPREWRQSQAFAQAQNLVGLGHAFHSSLTDHCRDPCRSRESANRPGGTPKLAVSALRMRLLPPAITLRSIPEWRALGVGRDFTSAFSVPYCVSSSHALRAAARCRLVGLGHPLDQPDFTSAPTPISMQLTVQLPPTQFCHRWPARP